MKSSGVNNTFCLRSIFELNFRLRIKRREEIFEKYSWVKLNLSTRDVHELLIQISQELEWLGWNNVSLFMNAPLFLPMFARWSCFLVLTFLSPSHVDLMENNTSSKFLVFDIFIKHWTNTAHVKWTVDVKCTNIAVKQCSYGWCLLNQNFPKFELAFASKQKHVWGISIIWQM